MVLVDNEPKEFFEYRGYLAFLARRHLSNRYNGKIDHSDIVQQTLVNAYTAQAQCVGKKEPEILAWLRQILVHVITHATRELHTKKRDINREQSIAADLDASSMHLEIFLADKSPSPSQAYIRKDNIRVIAAAIESLSEDQRQVLIGRYWEGKSMQEIADALGKSIVATAGLRSRATRKLRELLEGDAI